MKGGFAPKVRKQKAKDLYLAIMKANEQNLIASSHDLSDGGLAVTLAESAMDAQLGATINLDSLSSFPPVVLLFSESHSRFVVSIKPQHKEQFEHILGKRAFFIGKVTPEPKLIIQAKNIVLITQDLGQLMDAWTTPF